MLTFIGILLIIIQKEEVAQTQLEKQQAEREFYRAQKEKAKGEAEKAKERAEWEYKTSVNVAR